MGAEFFFPVGEDKNNAWLSPVSTNRAFESDIYNTMHVRRKGAAPLSGAEEQAARAISAHAQCACLLSLQMGSIN